MSHLLDNIIWHSLSGPHARFAAGRGAVRRYAKDFSAIAGVPEPQRPDFAALAEICELDEQIYCPEWSGTAPAGWRIHDEQPAFRMTWQDVMPEDDAFPDAVPLGPQQAAQALELAQLTNPGPFGLRTLELGDYFGWFLDGILAAMAGERMRAGPYREVSGNCTHPDFRGCGLALRLYCAMGFRDYCEITLRVISRC